MSDTSKPKRPSKKWGLFACGAVAPLSVYIIFYAKHTEALLKQIEELYANHGVLGILVVFVLFSFVALGCGTWALFCESKTYKAAFSAGLGLPALILSGSGALAPKAGKESAQRPVQMAALAPNGLLAAVDTGIFKRAFSIVFDPVGGLIEGGRRERQMDVNKMAVLEQANQRLSQQGEELRGVVAALEKDNAKVKQESAVINRALTAAKAMEKTGRQELALRDRRIAELENEQQLLAANIASTRRNIEDLQTQMAERERALSASGGDRELLVKELKRAQSEKEDYARAFQALAKSAGTGAINGLGEALRTATNAEVKIAVIKAIGQTPRAVARSDIRSQLDVLERTGSPEVKEAVRIARRSPP